VTIRASGRSRPKFLNRLDEVILFRRLQPADMAAIVPIRLEHLRKLLADPKIVLELGRSALE
jgi:ATP-dependent Clp protease ATP-binding subunit ClpB